MIAFLLLVLLMPEVKAEILTFEDISRSLSKNRKTTSVKAKGHEGVISRVLETKRLRRQLEETKKKLNSYRYITKLQLNGPYIMKDSVVREADLIGAVNEFAIYATTTPKRVVLTNLKGSDIPSDAKIVCQVFTKYKRICGLCNRLIINGKGQDIDAELYNRDGSPCAIGKISDDGEDYLIGVGISALAQGALSVAQGSTPTAYGNVIQNTAKNQLSKGMQNVGSEATELFKEEYKTREPIVTLKRNSPVAVLFNKEVTL